MNTYGYQALTIDLGMDLIYVAGSGYISVIDGNTNTVIGTTSGNCRGIAIDPSIGDIYTMTRDSINSSVDSLAVFDELSMTGLAEVLIGWPTQLDANPETHRVCLIIAMTIPSPWSRTSLWLCQPALLP